MNVPSQVSWMLVSKTKNQKLGQQMHGSIVKSCFASQGYVCISLLTEEMNMLGYHIDVHAQDPSFVVSPATSSCLKS